MTTEDVTVLKDEVGAVKHQVTGMQDVLNKILEQGNAASADRAKFQTSIERMEKETKALVAENARGLKEFKERQSEQNLVFDSRISGLDASVTSLRRDMLDMLDMIGMTYMRDMRDMTYRR